MRNPKMASMHHYDSVQESQLEYLHKLRFRIILQTQTTKVEMSHYDCFIATTIEKLGRRCQLAKSIKTSASQFLQVDTCVLIIQVVIIIWNC